MRKRLTILLLACAAMTVSRPLPVHAAAEISASVQINAVADFNEPLTPYGSWVTVGSYGSCWHPARVEADWEPYSNGNWEWTDAGWYWQSDEPWSWACYHYGSWYNDPRVGWVWIPGTDWAPAWVTWRYSDDYIGWAPCGPGLSVLAPSFFVFCDVHRFGDHFHRRDLIVNNTTIINRTKVIKTFDRQTVDFNGRQRTIFANKGPGVESIQRATGAKFTARPVRDIIRETHRPENIRRDEGQRQDQRPDQKQEQRPAVEQRHDIPAPTGQDQPRTYQQPQRQLPEPPKQPERKTPDLPNDRPNVVPPTGREEPRVYHEIPKPNPLPEQRREVPVPAPRPVTPPERILPPTGRDEIPHAEHPQAPPIHAPEVKPAPVVPQAPAGGHDRDGNKDANKP